MSPGDLVGNLSEEVAASLGLSTSVAVAASILDAHAGGLAMLSAQTSGLSGSYNGRLGMSDLMFCKNTQAHIQKTNLGPED